MTARLAITIAACLAGMAAITDWEDEGSRALVDHGVIITHTSAEGTTAKGETRPIKELLKRYRFQWYRVGGFWFVPRTRGLSQSPIDLDRVRQEAEAILSGEAEPPNVAAFVPRSAPARQAPPLRGHTGDVAFLLPGGGSVSLSDIYGSTGIRFGTSAPFAIGRVGPDRIGFADYPMISVDMLGKDSSALVPIARQLAMIAAAVNGLYLDMGVPSVKIGRETMATDQNPSSPSVGKRKRLKSLIFMFEIKGVRDPDLQFHSYVRSRHSSSPVMKIDGSGMHPLARPLTREEIVKSGHVKA
jgi:hypothetical protein